MPAYGGGAESFLENVVTPIYIVIEKVLFFVVALYIGVVITHSDGHKLILLKNLKETKKSKNGSASYSTWRNYDDLNEYFWLVISTNFLLFTSASSFIPILQGAANLKLVLLLYFFRSPDCFELGWPLRLDHDFFHVDDPNEKNEDDLNKKKTRFRFRNGKKAEERQTEGNEDTEPVV